jgi:hypothetical protein
MTFGPVVTRQLQLADVAARGEQAAWQRERADAVERAREQHEQAALAVARTRTEAAGDFADVWSLARGEVPSRTLGDVLGESLAAADRPSRDLSAPYGSEANPAILVDGAEMPEPARRSSGWPASEHELDRMISQADDLHRARVAWLAEHDYAAAEAAARAKAGSDVSRSGATGYREIVR